MKAFFAALGIFLYSSGAAAAAEVLSVVETDVYTVEGVSANDIVQRGLQCLKSTAGNTADAVDPSVEGDSAYAIVKTEYAAMLNYYTLRSRAVVVAKDGRFKVRQVDIEEWMDAFGRGDWMIVKKQTGTGWKKAEAALAARNKQIADCIVGMNKPDDSDW